MFLIEHDCEEYLLDSLDEAIQLIKDASIEVELIHKVDVVFKDGGHDITQYHESLEV